MADPDGVADPDGETGAVSVVSSLFVRVVLHFPYRTRAPAGGGSEGTFNVTRMGYT